MKLLAFDTSTALLSVALGDKENNNNELVIKASMATLSERQHGETLAPAVNRLLKQVDWAPQTIEGVVVGIGPGSYTGLRIGVTFAKVWASSKNIPLYTVSSLALMAAGLNHAPQGEKHLLIPMMDARRGTVYTGLYHMQEGRIVTAREDRHIDFTEWLDTLAEEIETADSVTLIGEGIDSFVKIFEGRFPNAPLNTVQDWGGWPHVERAFTSVPMDLVEDIDVLVPNYTHVPLAEREWVQRTAKPGGELEQNPAELIDHYN